ncbi:hypothetical protein BQ8794_240207 [Mesorhizobium prunaredense]|uniref:Uncharacterized protein n=1 Tax=Mesorhizobium prunaredense TaxID=1631249 RepID=A0A1R3V7Y0_9HYPH|nr:hypothetical protein BQ8794_240207 [Mesorhizobium prunaredense]
MNGNVFLAYVEQATGGRRSKCDRAGGRETHVPAALQSRF